MYDAKAVKRYEEGRSSQQKGQLSAAERAYRKAIKIEPAFVEAHNNLGNVLVDRNRIREAGQAYLRALRLRPDNPMLLNNLGNALLLQGQYEPARERLQRAIELDPGYAEAHNNLGNALRHLGSLDAASDCFSQAIALSGGRLAEACSNLGTVLAEQGNDADARIRFDQAIAVDPDCKEAHCGLGNIHFRAERIEAAIAAFRRALRVDRQYADASIGLGFALIEQGDYATAIANFEQLRRTRPHEIAVRNGLALALHRRGDLELAAAAYGEALELDASDEAALCGFGGVLSDRGDLAGAVATIEQAIAAHPASDLAYRSLGKAYSDHGAQEQAVAVYRRAIDAMPGHTEPCRLLALNKRFSRHDDDLAQMEALLECNDLADPQAMHLAFALAKAYEDLGDYERAWTSMRQANRLRRAASPYSAEPTERLFDDIKQVFSADFFAARSGSGHADATPIFIVGMPRSGTSLVEQILASHEQVFGGGEIRELERLVDRAGSQRRGGGERFPRSVPRLSSDELAKLGRDYLAYLRKFEADAIRVTDKMPQNFLRIGLIRVALPKARIVHCRRDPIDTCLSIYKNFFTRGHLYSNDLVDLGGYYRRYLDLMAHWRSTLPSYVYELDYEELIANQEAETRRLLDYCELDWNPACLRFHETSRLVKTISKAQVRQPIYADSVKLAQRYGARLEPLRAAIFEAADPPVG